MKKNIFILIVLLISVMALSIRIPFMNYLSHDMENFVLVWMEQLESNGGIKALGLEIGNYNIVYMTLLALLIYIPLPRIILVKMISIIFDFIIAWAGATIIANLVKKEEVEKKIIFLISYAIILIAPTLILNSAVWGQCDSIYVAFIMLSVLFFIKEKYFTSIIMVGIAFAFKLQAIFIFPLYGLIYLGRKKFPFYYFVAIPIVNFISWLPAILKGRSITSCINIYLGQTETINNLITRNFVNIYNFIFNKNVTFIQDTGNTGWIGIVALLAIFIIFSVIIAIKRTNIKGEMIFLIGIWGTLISTFLLPHMHERYIIIADVLSIVYAIAYKGTKWIAISINFISLYLYIIYLRKIYIFNIEPFIIAILFLMIVIYLTEEILYKIFKKNQQKEVEI